MRKLVVAMSMCMVLGFGTQVLADDDARDYIPAPPGTDLMITYFRHTSSNELKGNGKTLSKDFNLTTNVAIFRVVHFTKLGPYVVDPQILIPAGEAHLDGAGVGGASLSATGIADPILAMTAWIVNDPKSKTWFGVTPFLTVPIGEYDKDRAVNLGANRWALKGEVGYVKGIGEKTYFELIANVEGYTDNKDYTAPGITMKQDALLTLESHLSYDISKTMYVAGDYYYHNGGETTVAGVKSNDKQGNHALQASMGFWLSPNHHLLLQYKDWVSVKSGPQSQTFGVRFLYAF
ncbi:MAG: transporter [Thermoleophilia bacterium]